MASVYFLVMHDPADSSRDFELVKIGITGGDVVKRIAHLQTGNPYGLKCLAILETTCARAVEHFIHRTHAPDMQQLEWLRLPRNQVSGLVEEARGAARRLEARNSIQQRIVSSVSNGEERRPEPSEIELHREARALKAKLVPEELRLETAESQLKAATGNTKGIPGIVRVERVPQRRRFNRRIAEERFNSLAAGCRIQQIQGIFRWRNVPRRCDFPEQLRSHAEATAAAVAAVSALADNIEIVAWAERSSHAVELHDEFLRATQNVHRLTLDLEDLESQLVVKLGEHDGLTRVCSYGRTLCQGVDTGKFRKAHPDEFVQCQEEVPAHFRKSVYTSRAYI